ncbi:cysteine desulfurase [Flavobacteriaceae bacterium]|nr:cysteine desulfurase [Flavobacteriaceae bacterium]
MDIQQIRSQFPILNQEVNGKPLAYFDNAATSQTPLSVIDAIATYYKTDNANIHRGVHYLSQKATDDYEEAREKVRTHIGASASCEVIFTTGTTMGINMVANGLRSELKTGDEILISELEHHANIVPWQLVCEATGAKLKVIPITDKGEINMDAFEELLSDKTKILSVSHISNTLGTINPIEHMIHRAHSHGAQVLIDGAQATPHLNIDVTALDCEYYVSSGHKMYGPTGVGFLYGKKEALNKLDVYQGGGEMIAEVTFEKTTYAELPHKFEAGTPNISGGIGLGAAIDYIQEIGIDRIAAREQELLDYAMDKLSAFEDIEYYGTSENKAAVISFNIKGIHPYDVGVILDKLGVAVRTGHHCTQPIMQCYNIPGTIRASFAFYNTFEEIDQFIGALDRAYMMLK